MVRYETVYHAEFQDIETGEYFAVGRPVESLLLCYNKIKEYLDTYPELYGSKFNIKSWRIVKKKIRIESTLEEFSIVFGPCEKWNYIMPKDISLIAGEHSEERQEKLKNLIEKYNFKLFKWLSEEIWDLKYPILDHFIMFKDDVGREFLISNTYLGIDEISNELRCRHDIEYEIVEDVNCKYLYNTTLLIIRKKGEI